MTRRFERVAAALACAALAASCERGARAPAAAASAAPAAGTIRAPVPAPTATPAAASAGTILFIGTSLTAGLGLDPDQAYPAVVGRRLAALGETYEVVNAGVSGETSADLRRRLDWLLRRPATVIFIETGANDGLRGLSVDSLRANLAAIVDTVRARQPAARIILAGMEALPNMGPAYAAAFRRVVPEVARREQVTLLPFLLAGVAGVDTLNQADGIHPNARGAELVAGNVLRVLTPVLDAPRRPGGAAAPR